MKIDRDPQPAKQVPLDIETMALSTRPLEPESVSPIIDHDPVSAGQPERTCGHSCAPLRQAQGVGMATLYGAWPAAQVITDD